jgi:sigma-B regulation protein RsbU (phosphoserine phosphatase)
MPTKILVVDDEPDLNVLITQRFRKRVRDNELSFAFAESGKAALRKLQEDPGVEVVLTDINMPEMDGLTLLAELKEKHPLINTVIVSAYGDMANIRTALNRGAFDFITKPVDFDDLEITLNKTLRATFEAQQAAHDRERLVALHRELEVAHRIQSALVPHAFPPFPERKDFELYAKMIPAAEVGGDFYDFFLIDQDRLGFVIGDVSDKGVPAALFMAVSKTLLKAAALTGAAPEQCLERVNNLLCLDNPSAMFVTVFYGVLNTATGEVVYSNAGHNSPFILRRDGKIEAAASTNGFVLGAFANTKQTAKQIQLQPGEGIFLYTDGITEAENANRVAFSEERLQEFLQRAFGSTLPEMIAGIIAAVKTFAQSEAQSDDLTVLALRYLG